MKRKIFLPGLIFSLCLLSACNNDKEAKTATNVNTTEANPPGDPVSSSGPLAAPEFADPELKQYYASYTAYINKVVASIEKKDEAGTMKLFSEEGKLFGNNIKMEQDAREKEEQVYLAWLMKALPYQKLVAESAYYKKFNEEYYKKSKDN